MNFMDIMQSEITYSKDIRYNHIQNIHISHVINRGCEKLEEKKLEKLILQYKHILKLVTYKVNILKISE